MFIQSGYGIFGSGLDFDITSKISVGRIVQYRMHRNIACRMCCLMIAPIVQHKLIVITTQHNAAMLTVTPLPLMQRDNFTMNLPAEHGTVPTNGAVFL